MNKEPPPAAGQEGVGLWVCRFGSEDVLLGLFVEEVHQLRTEAVLDGLVAAVDSADVDVGRRNDDDDVLAVGVDVQSSEPMSSETSTVASMPSSDRWT